MKVLLATGLSIEQQMESKNWHRCFQRQVLIDVVKERKPEVVVLSEYLPDSEDLMEIIRALRTDGIRIIFLPGDAKMPDAKEWMGKLIPWGIYDYVFDPVTAEKIIDRVNNPAQLKDLPAGLRQMSSQEAQAVGNIIPDDLPETKKGLFNSEIIQNISSIIGGIKKPQLKLPFKPKIDHTINLPVPVKKQAPKLKKGLMLFTRTGIIHNNQYIKIKFSSPEEITTEYDAIVIPSSKGIGFVKDFRRKNPMIPIVVLKGNKSFIAAGADKCVSKITPSVIVEVYALISRIQELWLKAETDPLTGLYTRRFLNEWIQDREQRNKYYSAVILDIDKFKSVNDTYGHDAGDAILVSLGSFLKSETRTADLVSRFGGEEFVVCLPDTTASEAHYLIDRLRQKWSQRAVTIPDGRVVKTTFSAGVAEWYPGADIIKLADKMLYQAKETGRNKVCVENKPNVLLLGVQGLDSRINITYDPKDAGFVITNSKNIKYATHNLPIYCIGTGSVSDWPVKQICPQAIMCSSFEEAVNKIIAPKDNSFFLGEKPKLTVLPGARAGNKGITIPSGGALYIVCPSRPAAAGEVSARLAEQLDNSALICATSASTAALSLGIPKEDLIETDWRIPGAKAPIQYGKVIVWPVDPYKYLNVPINVHSLVDQIKSRFSLAIIDCGGGLDVCSRIARDEGVLVLAREGDKSDEATHHWLENYGGLNITIFSPADIPNILPVDNGFILSKASIAAER